MMNQPINSIRAKDGTVVKYEAMQHEESFTQDDLKRGRLLVVHNLGRREVAVWIYNHLGVQVFPDEVTLSGTDSVVINLNSYAPIQGTWTAIVKA